MDRLTCAQKTTLQLTLFEETLIELTAEFTSHGLWGCFNERADAIQCIVSNAHLIADTVALSEPDGDLDFWETIDTCVALLAWQLWDQRHHLSTALPNTLAWRLEVAKSEGSGVAEDPKKVEPRSEARRVPIWDGSLCESHHEFAKRHPTAKPCTCHDLTFGGRCLNCGYTPTSEA
jgi:hypothetical protein